MPVICVLELALININFFNYYLNKNFKKLETNKSKVTICTLDTGRNKSIGIGFAKEKTNEN